MVICYLISNCIFELTVRERLAKSQRCSDFVETLKCIFCQNYNTDCDFVDFTTYTIWITKLLSVLCLTSNIFGVALSLIFSFTNGEDWDGPYRLQFQVPKPLKNKPIEFFNEVNFLTY
jgi:hypothetical protein